MSELILKYIEKDPISYIHIRDLLDRNYSIIFESTDGFIIKDNTVNFIYMSFSNEKVMKEELSKTRYYHYLAYEKEIVDFYGDNEKIIKLSQYVYPSSELFDISGYDIRTLDEKYAPILDSFYKAIGPGESNLDALKNKEVLGIFDNNNLAGIIGRHPERCMGMLHVFEDYRRKGYGEVLEKAMINKLISEKERVFCEVVDGNAISEHLQNKLGLIKGQKLIHWVV